MSDITNDKSSVVSNSSAFDDLFIQKFSFDITASARLAIEKLSPPVKPTDPPKNPRLGALEGGLEVKGSVPLLRGNSRFFCDFRIGALVKTVNQIQMDVDALDRIVKRLDHLDPQGVMSALTTAASQGRDYDETSNDLLRLFKNSPPDTRLDSYKDASLKQSQIEFARLKKNIDFIQENMTQLMSLVEDLNKTRIGISRGDWTNVSVGFECGRDFLLSSKVNLQIATRFKMGALIDSTLSILPGEIDERITTLQNSPSVSSFGNLVRDTTKQSGAFQASAKIVIDEKTLSQLRNLSQSLNTLYSEFQGVYRAGQNATTVGGYKVALSLWNQFKSNLFPIATEAMSGLDLSRPQKLEAVITRGDKLGLTAEGSIDALLKFYPNEKSKMEIGGGIEGKLNYIPGSQTENFFTASLDEEPFRLKSKAPTTLHIDNVAPLLGLPSSFIWRAQLGWAEQLKKGILNIGMNIEQTLFIPGPSREVLGIFIGYSTPKATVRFDYKLRHDPLFVGEGFPPDCGLYAHELGIKTGWKIGVKYFDLKASGGFGEGVCSLKASDATTPIPMIQGNVFLNGLLKF